MTEYLILVGLVAIGLVGVATAYRLTLARSLDATTDRITVQLVGQESKSTPKAPGPGGETGSPGSEVAPESTQTRTRP
jgi:hypothetical protein